MTLEDAKKVAAVVEQADGGCESCVGWLCEKLDEAFPEFDWSLGDNRPDAYGRQVVVTPRVETLADA